MKGNRFGRRSMIVSPHWRTWVFVTMFLTASFFTPGRGETAPPVFAPPELVLELPTTGNYGILAAADFTGDGLLDVVVARGLFMTAEVFPLAILVNDGNGRFVDRTTTIFIGPLPVVQNPREIVIADFNGDGRPDIFIADHGDDRPPFPGFQNQLVLSTPDGRLVNATANLPQQSDFTHSAATADIDGDGDLDLFIGNLGTSAGWGGAQIWLNDGTGRFTIAPGRLPSEQTLRFYTTGHFADVNGDGKPDLLLGGGDFNAQDSAVLLNDGIGFFSLLPNAMPPKPFAPTDNAVNIKSTDLNGDGFPDLLVSFTKSVPYYRGRWIQVLINNGNGTFRDETATRLPQTDNNEDWIKFLDLRDLDGDGDLDIGTWLDANHTDPPPFYLNDGTGVFTPLPLGFGNIATGTGTTGHTHNLYAWLDADGDGGRDILTTFPGCGTTCFPIEQHFLVREVQPPRPVAALLPSSRSVPVGVSATAFATIINTGQPVASGCSIVPVTSLPGIFFYQTTNPATNQVIGTPNTPVDIAAGAAQSFVFAFTPMEAIAPTEVQFSFDCANTNPAPINTGLNTLLLSSSATPVPDIVALAATATNDGIVNILGANGTGAFAVATVNVGASGSITASADTGSATLAVNISLCQTDPSTAHCISAIDSTVTTTINANATPTFGIFVQGNGTVPFDPAGNRIFVRFKDGGNVTRGSTSVAVRTQ